MNVSIANKCTPLVVGIKHSRDVVEFCCTAVEQVQHVVLLVAQHGSRGPQLL